MFYIPLDLFFLPLRLCTGDRASESSWPLRLHLADGGLSFALNGSIESEMGVFLVSRVIVDLLISQFVRDFCGRLTHCFIVCFRGWRDRRIIRILVRHDGVLKIFG